MGRTGRGNRAVRGRSPSARRAAPGGGAPRCAGSAASAAHVAADGLEAPSCQGARACRSAAGSRAPWLRLPSKSGRQSSPPPAGAGWATMARSPLRSRGRWIGTGRRWRCRRRRCGRRFRRVGPAQADCAAGHPTTLFHVVVAPAEGRPVTARARRARVVRVEQVEGLVAAGGAPRSSLDPVFRAGRSCGTDPRP